MQPFDISPILDPLTETYPPAELLLEAVKTGDRSVRCAISRLWLSEGIPFAFKAKPGVYEALRVYLARRIDVEAKEITIIGSGRQGFSLSPGQNVGRPFGPHSDLDFTAVSTPLFQRLRDAFYRWAGDYKQGLVNPRNQNQKKYWDANINHCPSELKRGFIDPYKIPTLRRYPEAQKVENALWVVREKLKLTPNAPDVHKVSLRVYRDWDSFIQQMAINLGYLRKSPPP